MGSYMKINYILSILCAFMFGWMVPAYGMQLPRHLNLDDALSIMQNRIHELTGKQIADCLAVFTNHPNGDEYLKLAYDVLENRANHDALARYNAYVDAASSDDDEEEKASISIPEDAFSSVDGLIYWMNVIADIKNNDSEGYSDLLEAVSSEQKTAIRVWFILAEVLRFFANNQEDYLKQFSSKIQYIVREALNALDVLEKGLYSPDAWQDLMSWGPERYNFIAAFVTVHFARQEQPASAIAVVKHPAESRTTVRTPMGPINQASTAKIVPVRVLVDNRGKSASGDL